MVVTANSGPFLGFGITTTSTGQVTQYNEERGPSVFDLGQGLADPRPFYNYTPGNAVGTKVLSLWDNCSYVDYIPTPASSNGIVSNSQAVSNTNLTLTATGAGVISTTIVAPETGTSVSVIAIDSTAAYVTYGQSGTIAAWNSRAGTGRTITIVLSSNLDGGSYFVAGRDMYGYKMTEQIATNSSNTIKGVKAFKYVSAISASSTVTSTGVIVGYGDTFGFPGYLPYVGLNSIVVISSAPTSLTGQVTLTSSNIVLASTVATQTSTTPDVRGTFTPATASSSIQRLQIFQGYDPFIMSTVGAGITGTSSQIFGPAQFSSV